MTGIRADAGNGHGLLDLGGRLLYKIAKKAVVEQMKGATT